MRQHGRVTMGRDRLGIIYFSVLVWEPTQKPTKKDAMRQGELQTPTLCFLEPCSIKLGYKIELCPCSGLNQGPSDLQSDALPTELHGHIVRKLWKLVPLQDKIIIKSSCAPASN